MSVRAVVLASLLFAGVSIAGTIVLSASERAVLAPVAHLWPTLDSPTQQRLQMQARDWLQRSPAARAELQARVRQWDALPPAQRTQRRTVFAAWLALDPAEQAQVAAAAQGYAALPLPQRQALRASFDALAADAREGWWLGPELGADFGGLRALFAFAPEAERPGLRALLRGLDAATRKDLATLASRLSDPQREQLREDLLAAPAEQRAAMIRARLAQ